MSDDFRHHRVSRDPDVRIVLVPVPVPEAGSPKQKHLTRPGPYPVNQRQPWQPQQDIPRRLTKSEKMVRFLDGIARNDEAARDHMANARRISAELRQAREQARA
jgi:hypothetical protein